MSILVEMWGGPVDGQMWEDKAHNVADIANIQTVTCHTDDGATWVMDALPSNRKGVLWALWATGRPVK